MKLPKNLQPNKGKRRNGENFKDKQEFVDFHLRPEIFLYTQRLEEEFEELRIFGDERDLRFITKCDQTSKIMCAIPKNSSLTLQELEELERNFDVNNIDPDNYMPICANCLKKTNEYLREFRRRHDKELIKRFREGLKIEDVEADEKMRNEVKEIIPFLKKGDHVKVKFIDINKRDKEFMWVEIKEKIDDRSFSGVLLGEPFLEINDNIIKGDTVKFSSSMIYDVIFTS